MKSFSLFGLLMLGLVVTGCGDSNTPAAPSPASSAIFTATLLPSNEMPPITGSESNGAGTATVTFNLTKDSAGAISAATLDVTVSATGFPAGTTLTASHIHSGAAGTNGSVFANFGLTAGEVIFANGSGTFTKRSVSLPVEQANAIMASPTGYYVNIHTADNPGGVARGQLTRVQ